MTFSRVCTGLGDKMQLYGNRMMQGSVYGVGGSFVTFTASLGSGLESVLGGFYLSAILFSSSVAVGGSGFVLRGSGKLLTKAPEVINRISQKRFKNT